jgi:hypothetical protein
MRVMMSKLKLTVNEKKTRRSVSCRKRGSIFWDIRLVGATRSDGTAYLGTTPSRSGCNASVARSATRSRTQHHPTGPRGDREDAQPQ